MVLEGVFIGLLGLLIGSFLNVCIYRIPKKESIAIPPSHCMNCNTRLKVLDLIPAFSYIFLKGKCRYCGQKISIRYPIIELITAVIFIAIYWKYSLTVDFFAYAYLMSILIAVFFIDIDYMIIPNKLVISALVGGMSVIIYNCFSPMEIYKDTIWWNPIVGMFLGSGILMIFAIVGMAMYKSKEVMGMGDIKILLPIGIFVGWKMIIVVLYLAIINAAIVCLVLISLKIKGRKSAVPFGPFIVIATFITIMWGWKITRLFL